MCKYFIINNYYSSKMQETTVCIEEKGGQFNIYILHILSWNKKLNYSLFKKM